MEGRWLRKRASPKKGEERAETWSSQQLGGRCPGPKGADTLAHFPLDLKPAPDLTASKRQTAWDLRTPQRSVSRGWELAPSHLLTSGSHATTLTRGQRRAVTGRPRQDATASDKLGWKMKGSVDLTEEQTVITAAAGSHGTEMAEVPSLVTREATVTSTKSHTVVKLFSKKGGSEVWGERLKTMKMFTK